MQSTSDLGGRFVRVPLMLLAAFVAAWPMTTMVRGEEEPAKIAPDANKAEDEAQRQQRLIQEQIDAEQKALEKQLREDPAWQPTHVQAGVIRVSPKPTNGFVNCFCLNTDGNVLVGCGGKRQSAEVKDGKVVVHTETDPTELRFYTPEGVLQKSWKIATEPQAIAMLPDGTVFVAGDGQLLKLDSDGKLVAKAPFPSLAEEKPAGKKDEGKKDEKKEEKKNKATVSLAAALGQALGLVDQGQATGNDQSADANAKAQAAAMAQYRRIATGLAVTDTEVFVVSLGSKDWRYSVWRMDHDFKQAKEIITGLIGCCGQMDIQAANGDLWIPENGRHRVTRYDRDGKKLASFGKHDRKAADGFGGCCEPKNLTIGPGGDLFTAESGEPVVVKRFSREGKFQNVVAIPKYKTGCVHVCVAASPDGRIFILDPGESAIHVFADQRKTPTHQFVRRIGVTDGESAAVQLNSFCLDAKGNVLAACSEQTSKGDIRQVSPEGKLLATWKLDFLPQAINRAADGTIFAGGSGKMAVLDAEGKVVREVKLPTDVKPPTPEEEKKLRDELKKIQADNAKLFSEFRDLQQQVVKGQRALSDAETDVDSALSDEEKKAAAEQVEKLKAQQKKNQAEFNAKIPEITKASQEVQKITMKLGPIGNRGTVTGIAATKRDLFVCRMPDVGYGYEVWRTDREFGNSKKIITGLAGCCGQMDIQADGDDLWIPENGRHQVHRYDRDGKKLATFGKNDRAAIDGFGGCCEPKNIRIVGDEIFTAESTQPVQIKHFGKDGRFRGIVAVPTYKTGCVRVCVEVSADRKRVYCLSPGENAIYVFEQGVPAEEKAVVLKESTQE